MDNKDNIENATERRAPVTPEGRRDGKPHFRGEFKREEKPAAEKPAEVKADEEKADEEKPAEVKADEAAVSSGKAVEIIGINFREAGKIYYFDPAGMSFSLGQRVIVDTARGTEIGTVKVANKEIPETEVVSPLKAVTRLATEADLQRDARNRELEMEAAIICKKKIAAHGLGMSLVAVVYSIDISMLIFYFTCESRVDFRELVKDLASTFRTRIELRQIGIRDEAKLMGGLGICGRKYCCAGFLSDFVQVTIKMAKEQNFSLNSAKVSGACGRLMCCLHYEHQVYEEALRVTPPVNSVVMTADGEGVVIETKPLASQIRVRLNDNEKDAPKLYSVSDVKILRVPKQKKSPKDDGEDITED